jgi:hypothetical protein
LEGANLITIKTEKGKHDSRFKVYRLTPRAETLIVDLQALLKKLEQPPGSLAEPMAPYWNDLQIKLYSTSEMVVKAAFGDLKGLCRSIKVWMLGNSFWNFLSNYLNRDDNKHFEDVIECVSMVQSNSAKEDGAVAAIIKERFSGKLERIVLQRKGVESEAMSCLKTMLSTEELLTFAEAALEEAFRLEEKEYGNQLSALIDTIRILYEKRNEDLRGWLYQKMASPDQNTATRSYTLYTSLS